MIKLLMAGSPCFVAGTIVRTIDGFKEIQDINIGDYVLTHMGRYKRVTNIMNKNVDTYVRLKTENCGFIECTPNHRFYTKEMKRVGHKNLRMLSNDFSWTPVSEFVVNRYLSGTIQRQTYVSSITDDIYKNYNYDGCLIQTNQFSTKICRTLNFEKESLWYIIGRYLGDGWQNYKYKKNGIKKPSGIKICCGINELEELKNKIEEAGFNYCISKEKTLIKFQIYSVELAIYLQRYGNYAYGKKISEEVFYLPDNLAKAMLNGYFDADGYITNDNIVSFTTTSKQLAYGIKYLINKYYNRPCSIRELKSPNNIIESRVCNLHKQYVGMFHLNDDKQKHYFIEGNYIFTPYKNIEYINKPITVYNMSVEDDESYTANGLIVHNCTFWSNARKLGRETEPSGLGWDLFKNYVIAKEKFKPDFFFYENNYSINPSIKNAISKELGTQNYMIDASLLSAQHREREYWFNWEVNQPLDKHISPQNILDSPNGYIINACADGKARTLKAGYYKSSNANFITNGGHGATGVAELADLSKCVPLYDEDGKKRKNKGNIAYEVADGYIDVDGENYSIDLPNGYYTIRKLTPEECEKLQTLPSGYTDVGIAATHRYMGIGNGWCAEVVKYILSEGLKDIPKDEKIVVLSLYDGIGTGRYVLDSLGFTNVKYLAYEIESTAIKVSTTNYPDIIQMGDAFDVRQNNWLDEIYNKVNE